MFIDHAKIHVKAGDGGPGMVSFHTEKFVTNGGPDGGDGGKGGDVVFVAVSRLSNLSSFRFKHKFVAEDGAKGMNRKMYGKGGADLEIAVPVGNQRCRDRPYSCRHDRRRPARCNCPRRQRRTRQYALRKCRKTGSPVRACRNTRRGTGSLY